MPTAKVNAPAPSLHVCYCQTSHYQRSRACWCSCIRHNSNKKKTDGTNSSAYLLIPHGVLHAVGVLLQAVPGVNLLLLKIILPLVLLGVIDHAVNVLLAQPALLVSDGDLLLLACMTSKKVLAGARG